MSYLAGAEHIGAASSSSAVDKVATGILVAFGLGAAGLLAIAIAPTARRAFRPRQLMLEGDSARRRIEEVLAENRGRARPAAPEIGIGHRTLLRRMHEYGLPVHRGRPPVLVPAGR